MPPAGIAGQESTHYVDWCAIAGGVAIASAVAIILFTFGTAIGLSMVSPYEGEGASRGVYLATLGLWTVWVVVSSFMAGGYVAGRMRRRIGDATEHEVEVRDGMHGGITWATGIIVASLLLAAGVSGVLGVAAKAGAAAGAAGAAAASKDADMTSYTVDSLFRPPAQSAGGTAPATSMDTAASSATTTPSAADRERAEVGRLLTFGLKKGEMSADNKAYIARLIANRTGISQAEAEKRVNDTIAQLKATADAARKVSVIIGFLTAATLLVGGAAAGWAATLGGRHRDQNTDHSAFWRWSA